MKLQRIELLDKIHVLSKKCDCQNAEQSKDCQNCKRIAELGAELLKLTKAKKKNTLTDHEYPDKRVSKRLWTSDMVEYVKESAPTHTCKDMAEYLGIEPQQVRSKCKVMKVTPKRDVEIYQFYDGAKIVAKGTIPEIAKVLGVASCTMHYYRRKTSENSVRKLIRVEG